MKNNTLMLIIVTSLMLISIFFAFRNRVTRSVSEKPEYPVLLVGTNAEYQPFTFIKNREIVGFDIDIIKETAKRLNKQIVIKDMSFDALLPELQVGNLHVVAAGLTPTEERAKRVLFTTPHLKTGGFVFCIKKGSTIKSLEDLKGKTVVVNEGYAAEQFISQFKDIKLLRLSSASVSEGLLALDADRGDAFIVAKAAIAPLLKDEKQKKKYDIFPARNTVEPNALAVSKHHAALIDSIEKVLFEMKQDGTIDRLAKKWELL
jgi:arginine/lysine/histidine transporter system substrate-binding protein